MSESVSPGDAIMIGDTERRFFGVVLSTLFTALQVDQVKHEATGNTIEGFWVYRSRDIDAETALNRVVHKREVFLSDERFSISPRYIHGKITIKELSEIPDLKQFLSTPNCYFFCEVYSPSNNAFLLLNEDKYKLYEFINSSLIKTVTPQKRVINDSSFSFIDKPLFEEYPFTWYYGFRLYNDSFQLGDFAYIELSNNAKPSIGCIKACILNKREKTYLIQVNWFYRAEDTGLAIQNGKEKEIDESKSFKWEIFGSANFDYVAITSVIGKCYAINLNDFPETQGLMINTYDYSCHCDHFVWRRWFDPAKKQVHNVKPKKLY